MPKIRWDGDAGSLDRAQATIEKGVKKIKDQVAEAVKGYKEFGARSEYALAQTAKRIKDAIDPQEKFNRKKQELMQLVAKEKLTTEQAAAALVKYQGELSKGSEAGRRRWKEQGEAAAAAARSQAELAAQGAKIKAIVETPLEAYRRKVLELGRAFRAQAISQEDLVRGIRKLKAERDAPAAAAAAKAQEEAAKRQKKLAMDAAELARRQQQIDSDNAAKKVAATKRVIATMQQEHGERKKQLAYGDQIKQSLETPTERYKRQVLELSKAFRAKIVDVETVRRAMRQYKAELNDAGKAGERAFGAPFAAQIGAALAGVFSISSAISLVRSEFEATRAMGQRIQRTQQTAAEAEAALIETVDSDPKFNWIMSQAKKIADDRSLPVAQVYQALDDAYGALGDAAKSVAAVKEAAQHTRDPHRMVEQASGIGFLMAIPGINSAEEASGYINILKRDSSIKGDKVAEHAVAVGTAYSNPEAGGTAAVGAATLATIAQAKGDKEGDRPRTAAVNMITITEKFFEAHRKRLKLAKEAIDTPDERLAYLMDDANYAEAKRFISEMKMKFESPSRGAVSAMFLDMAHRAKWRERVEGNDDAEERTAAARSRKEKIKSGTLQANRETEAVLERGSEKYDLGSEYAIKSANRELLIQDLAAARNFYMFDMRWRARAYDGDGSLTRPEAIELIRANLDAMRNPDGSYAAHAVGPNGPRTDDQVRALEGLQERLDKLIAIEERLAEEAAATAAHTAELSGKKRAGRAAHTKTGPAKP